MCILPAVEVTSDQNQTLLYLGADHAPPKGMTAPEIMAHVHAECLGRGNATAWTQPFWMRA